ncbi:DUF362 domain-containing protein [Candidatus Nitrospira neomarina]|uniref:DUF362 domain-containing protein n=1 Tax=Candidatus Nitrospira neomarina TaxID=3020899 RepID=A0AA96K0D1_9BACT|nr:DUF362 domain-containing protein [Candidatus Nitrospira neomarina]WNM61936.1 DUF362 domain-containing protein [Candidatus Nitrospira neomarina]
MTTPPTHTEQPTLSRRQLLQACLVGGGLAVSGFSLLHWLIAPRLTAHTFIGQAETYNTDLAKLIRQGFQELGITPLEIKGKRILLKPNLVEPHQSLSHINTHPLVIRGAVEAFLSLGAASVLVAEGPGHRHDTLLVLEESGLADVLYEDHIPFRDLNTMEGVVMPNLGGQTRMASLTFPRIVKEVDWVVSLAKMKTHHWAGVTLSMKNFFGVMPGNYYGWPKNVLHHAGIPQSILDINATLKPHFAIVDGIIGMEGDGPIMGTPVQSGVLVMGRNLPAVDATCCRIMGINPDKIEYLRKADQWLGPIHESLIEQRGESWRTVHRPFALVPDIPAHQGLRSSHL